MTHHKKIEIILNNYMQYFRGYFQITYNYSLVLIVSDQHWHSLSNEDGAPVRA